MKKRFLDILIAVPSVLFLSPVLVSVAILNLVFQRTPVFFRQMRPGQRGEPFLIYKFCTMTNCCDMEGCLLPDDQRLTRLGRFLRATSLDELPELVNVLKGEMSVVGPRPLLMQYLDRYTPEQARRHKAKPGITGWAQVNGRNAISWEEKFKLDVWYVDHCSFFLDVKILALTIKKIFNHEGINQPGHATVEYFQGKSNNSEE